MERIRTAPAVLAAFALACGGAEPSGSATSAASLGKPKQHATYLALGDSIAFGFDPTVNAPKNENAYAGYPELLAELAGLRHVNAACPGETSGSFLDATAPDNGCRDFRATARLHAKYDGTQLAFALGYLAENPVEIVTIALGANDLLLLLQQCGGDLPCAAQAAPPVIGQAAANFAAALAAIRGAGYTGRILVPLYYPPLPGPIVAQAVAGLNGALVQVGTAFGAEFVDAAAAFAAAGPDACAAGLLIPLADGTCDKHPSAAGDAVIAGLLAGVL
jgi:lysophospholipase L1-like esterase